MEKSTKKISLIFFVVIVIALIVYAFFSFSKWFTEQEPYTENNIRAFAEVESIDPVDSSRLMSAIQSAASYFNQIILDNGQFIYRTNPDTQVNVKPRYNILRHAGSIYALCMYYNLTADTSALRTAERGGRFLREKTIKKVNKNKNLLGIWTLPEIVHDNDPPELKLGGTGLGLVALCSLWQQGSKPTSLDTLIKLGNFLLYMQKEDGSFYSKYYPHKKGRDDSWTSLYYPGEAALGLLMLYEINPRKKWLDGATKAIEYLARIRRGKAIVEADHWALLASELLLKNLGQSHTSEEIQSIINHAMTICRSIINTQASFKPGSIYQGCFTPDGRTTPTSTRLEGLLSAVKYIPLEDTIAIGHILMQINGGINFLLNAQIKQGPYAGAITRGFVPGDAFVSGHFNTPDPRFPEIRIDYIQHALSAWIQYYQIFYK